MIRHAITRTPILGALLIDSKPGVAGISTFLSFLLLLYQANGWRNGVDIFLFA
jgi:hypothetical protein